MIKIVANNETRMIYTDKKVSITTNADEMFKELGYKNKIQEKKYLRYNNGNSYQGEWIDFDLKNKKVRVTNVTCQGNRHFKYVSVKELEAIIQQIKELGWN